MARKRKRVRRLFFDIETSPNIGFFWQAGHDINVTPQSIIHERKIITICWKWAGERKVSALTWNKRQDDKGMLKRFMRILESAEEVVAHNGDRFDIKWLRTRCILHNIPMRHDVVTLDTCKAARGKFNFNSNKLDYIARYLGIGGKLDHEGLDLWKAVVLDKDPKALAHMVAYCKRDVVLLEKVWDRMNSYLPAKTNIAVTTRECPECGSDNIHIAGYRTTAAGYKKVRLQCQDCGKYHQLAASRFHKGKRI